MARGSDPVKVRQWTKRLERFAKSERGVSEFCEREGVSTASFYQWRQKLTSVKFNNANADRDGQPEPFRQLQMAALPSGVTVRLPDGIVIDLGSDLPTIEFVVSCLLDRQAAGTGEC